MTVEVAFLISVVSAVFAIYFGLKNSKTTDKKEIEQRAAERAETNTKLDRIATDVSDIKADINSTKQDVRHLSERVIMVEQSAKSLHHRVDTMEGKLNKTEKEV